MKRKASTSHKEPSKRVKISSDNLRPSRYGKRLVILDGSNVAFFHSNHNGFSVKGLQIALNEISKMGHEVIAIVPQYRMHPNKTSDYTLLQNLVDSNLVKIVCINTTNCRDDCDILNLAKERNGVIVSNDNYLKEAGMSPEFREIIENRLIPFFFFKDKFMLPVDPYGETGPTLDAILNGP